MKFKTRHIKLPEQLLISEEIMDIDDLNQLSKNFNHNSWEIKKDMLGHITESKWTPPSRILISERIE